MATKTLSVLCVVGVLLLSAVSAQATLITIPLTSDSYNQDAIYALAADTHHGNGLMGADWSFYEAGGGRPAGGVPAGGLISGSGGVSFQLASYTANNMLLLTAEDTSRTMTLATPGQFSTLSFLGTSGSGDTVTPTLNFASGAPTVGTPFSIPSSDGSGPTGVFDALLLNSNLTTYWGTPPWGQWYQRDYAVSVGDQARTLQSVTFSYTSNGGSRVGIFAVSGNTAVPEPATTGLLGMAAVSGLLAYAWRKRK
jgi:hypothetical protein